MAAPSSSLDTHCNGKPPRIHQGQKDTCEWLLQNLVDGSEQDTILASELAQKYNSKHVPNDDKENRLSRAELGKLLRSCFPYFGKKRVTLTKNGGKSREWAYTKLKFLDDQETQKFSKNELEIFWNMIPEQYKLHCGWCLNTWNGSASDFTWVATSGCDKINGIPVVKELQIWKDLSFSFRIMGKEVCPSKLPSLTSILLGNLNFKKAFERFLNLCNDVKICRGFVTERSSSTYNQAGAIIGKAEKWSVMDINGDTSEELHHRAIDCELVLSLQTGNNKMCKSCAQIKHNSFYKNLSLKVADEVVSKFKRESYMTSDEQRQKLHKEKKRRLAAEKSVNKIRKKIDSEMLLFQKDDHQDFLTMFQLANEKIVSEDMKIFFDAQKENLTKKNAKGYRWHPKIIRMCLSIWNRSPKAYEELKESGMLKLPSGRILQKYKNSIKQEPGINSSVLELMKAEAEKRKIPPHGMIGGIMLDEMAIQEDLQMRKEKGTMKLIGLVDIGEEDSFIRCAQTGKDEAVLANQVLQFVFVGNTGFRMPFAHWPTKQTSPATMLFTFWKAVHSLLLTGFEVIYCCLDGSSVNRSFVKLHFKGKDPVAEKFTVLNPYTREKFLFIMDPEHNLKKLRNNVLKSKEHPGAKRYLHKGYPDTKLIVWSHWENAYNWDQLTSGLKRYHLLKPEHFELTPSSLMRNHLAEQVLNRDMKLLMEKYQRSLPANEQQKISKTIEFLQFTSSLIDIFHSKEPFFDAHDARLVTLQNSFEWLQEWEEEVEQLSATSAEKKKMILSDKTIFDVYSMILGFMELCKIISARFPGTCLFSWRINTNIVENVFCQQRSYHGQNDNPRYVQYGHAMNSILLGQKTTTDKSNTKGVETLPMISLNKRS